MPARRCLSTTLTPTHNPARPGIYGVRPLASYFLGLSPLTPAFVLFVWSCGGVGFLVGCLPVFPLVFHGECGVGLVNSVGLRGHLLGWGENARGRYVDASIREG